MHKKRYAIIGFIMGVIVFTVMAFNMDTRHLNTNQFGTNGTASSSIVIKNGALTTNQSIRGLTTQVGITNHGPLFSSGAGRLDSLQVTNNTLLSGILQVDGLTSLAAATATTPAEDDNDTSVATTAYVQTEIASIVAGSLTTNFAGLNVTNNVKAATATINGAVSSGSATVTNTMTAGTSSVQSGTNGTTRTTNLTVVAGATVAAFTNTGVSRLGGNVTVSNDITVAGVTTVESITAGGDLTVSGTSDVQDLTVNGTLTADTIAATTLNVVTQNVGTINLTNPVPLAAGGTASSLTDPGAHAAMVWDNTNNSNRLASLSGLTYDPSANSLTAAGSGIATNGGSGTNNILTGVTIVSGDGSGLTNYAHTSGNGMPSGKWRGIFCCDSISLNYPTNTTNGSFFQDLDFRFGTNVSVGGQKMATAFASYTNSIQPWSPRIMGGDTNAVLFLQTGNHDIAAGTNAVDAINMYSNFVRLAHLDGIKVVAWTLHNHGGDTNATDTFLQKAKFNMLLRNLREWDWLYPFSEMFTLPNITISTDGIHPSQTGNNFITFGLEAILRNGERNPIPIHDYIRPQHIDYGFTSTRGSSVIRRLRSTTTGFTGIQMEDEATSSISGLDFGNGIMSVWVHASSGNKAETDKRIFIDTITKISGNVIATNAITVLGALTNGVGGFYLGAGAVGWTNYTSSTNALDFPDTVAGTHSDLPITVTGVTTNDAVSVTIPWQMQMPNSTFGWFPSNDTIWVRFVNSSLAASQNPTVGVVRYEIRRFK